MKQKFSPTPRHQESYPEPEVPRDLRRAAAIPTMNREGMASTTSVLNGSTGDRHSGRSRIEKDLIGAGEIPADVYWGIHTLRALQNFPVTGIRISSYPVLVTALAQIKRAAVLGNLDLGLMSEEKKDAIAQACREIEQGQLLDQFVVDVIQGGAGSPSVMNVNEVIANRALEILGHHRGAYAFIHPLSDVNMRQSTTEVYAMAIQIAAIKSGLELLPAMAFLRGQLARKALEFEGMATVSPTPAQDPLPMTLAQEFRMCAAMVNEDERSIREALVPVHEFNLGGTAIGTGTNTHPEYALAHLRQITGLPLEAGGADPEEHQACSAFVLFSGALKRTAIRLSGICSNLRLLSSGPWTGLAGINPAIPEAVNQVAFNIVGNDLTITMAAEEGQGQSSVFKPIIAQSLLASLAHLTSACTTLAEHCISGITADNHVRPQTKESNSALRQIPPYDSLTAATSRTMKHTTGAEPKRAKGLSTRTSIDEP